MYIISQLSHIQIAQQALKVVQAASATLPQIPQRQAAMPIMPVTLPKHQTLVILLNNTKLRYFLHLLFTVNRY